MHGIASQREGMQEWCSAVMLMMLSHRRHFTGVEGVITLCKALQGSSIHTLAIDMNLKVGMFTSGKEAGEVGTQQ